MKCIICREDGREMSDEHVIPDSLGGYYHIYSVCKSCNSNMGSHIDSPLINHKLTELYRFSQEIPGKNGAIPNPFSGTLAAKDNPDLKARVIIAENGKLETLYLPSINLTEENGELKSIEIGVDSKEEHTIDAITKKILKRNGLDNSHIIKSERKTEELSSHLSAKWTMDAVRFKIGLLKIAYEFTVDSIPEYFNDQSAIEISEILKSADYEAATKYVSIGSGLHNQILEPFLDFIDLSSKKHYLIITNSHLGLLCFVKLHDLFVAGVIMSADGRYSKENITFGINDIDGKKFRKISLAEAASECFGPIHTRFAYYCHTREEEKALQMEVNSTDYRYEGNERGEIPLYKKNGDKHPFFVHEILDPNACQSRQENGWKIEVFHLNPNREYFIKSVKSGRLHQVVAFEMSQEKLKKL